MAHVACTCQTLQIVDITLPYNSVLAAAITDDAGEQGQLNGESGIAIRDTPSGTYALVASRIDSAVQIVEIARPDELLPLAAVTDDVGGFVELDGVHSWLSKIYRACCNAKFPSF